MPRCVMFCLSLLLCNVSAVAAESERPNVLFILVDDLGLHDLSGEGSRFYHTPRIDQLARDGMRFTQGYATCRVCSPSRASIQTGKFTARHGITQWIGAASGLKWKREDRLLPAEYLHALPHEDVTIAEAMQEAGYRTFFAGKWHLGGQGSWPTDHGYDINVGGHDRGSPPGGYFSPYKNPLMTDGPDGESLPLRLADETAKFIKTHREQPFFAMLSFYSVHGPVQTTQALWQKYRKAAPKLPAGQSRFKVDRTLPVRQVQDHPIYAGMMETLDQSVGHVLDALDTAGLSESTIVIFTSDNGGVSSGDAYATSNLPLRGGKGRQWEGGIREPFYIKYPKRISKASSCDTPVTGADFYPTLLDLCGVPSKPEQHVDGVSLVPLLENGSIQPRPLYWHYPHYDNQGGEPSSLFRDGQWKLIHYYEDGRNELYNLEQDPYETSDLSLAMPVRTASMAKQLDEWLQAVKAKLPEPDPRYDPEKTEAKFHRIQTANKANLERSHAAMLAPDWQPDPSWWGSMVSED
ncbi:sulfatase [Novipirellula artificiosorum]|uniref:Arylsulfatase n=1 Tax=Novipirellula artificiosorum TaxID=2528016 RepID=A0A5C6DCI0_9BACT|nr:sulfatase [Novipirellula artificiosorum]TWU34378.1 Arylsulfatase precursor [Novipirellula artificiosorum]